jgi:hypothetical protein
MGHACGVRRVFLRVLVGHGGGDLWRDVFADALDDPVGIGNPMPLVQPMVAAFGLVLELTTAPIECKRVEPVELQSERTSQTEDHTRRES